MNGGKRPTKAPGKKFIWANDITLEGGQGAKYVFIYSPYSLYYRFISFFVALDWTFRKLICFENWIINVPVNKGQSIYIWYCMINKEYIKHFLQMCLFQRYGKCLWKEFWNCLQIQRNGKIFYMYFVFLCCYIKVKIRKYRNLNFKFRTLWFFSY